MKFRPFFIFLLVLIYGCSHTAVQLDYKKHNLFASDNADGSEYKELGPVSADNSDFVWKNCKKLTLELVEEMIRSTKAMGGNAIINVKWEKGDQLVTTPTCVTRHGWWVLYVLPGLGPWMKRASVSGTAVKIRTTNDKTSLNFIKIPKNQSIHEVTKNYVNKIKF